MKFSEGLRNIPGVENYSVALRSFQGDCEVFRDVQKFSGRVDNSFRRYGVEIFSGRMRIFHKELGFFRKRLGISSSV